MTDEKQPAKGQKVVSLRSHMDSHHGTEGWTAEDFLGHWETTDVAEAHGRDHGALSYPGDIGHQAHQP